MPLNLHAVMVIVTFIYLFLTECFILGASLSFPRGEAVALCGSRGDEGGRETPFLKVLVYHGFLLRSFSLPPQLQAVRTACRKAKIAFI